MNRLLTFVLLLGISIPLLEAVILKPTNPQSGKPQVAFVILQGFQIAADAYSPLGLAVQNSSADYEVWVSIPEFPLNIAATGQWDAVQADLKKMREQGLSTSAPLFLSGHSYGGVAVQDLAKDHSSDVKGVVLYAAPLERKNRDGYPLPILTVGGELDGLLQVTRIADAFYYQVEAGANPWKYPVVILKGVSHMSFASGEPTDHVKKNDLRPEVSEIDGHSLIASVTSAFFTQVITGTESSVLGEAKAVSKEVADPIIAALKLEGYIHFKPSCALDNRPASCPAFPGVSSGSSASGSCACGNDWVAQYAQPVLAGLEAVSWNVVDGYTSFGELRDSRKPSILGSCTAAEVDERKCTLKAATLTELNYNLLDDFDASFTPSSANEIRAKLNSRQAILKAVGISGASKSSDDGNLCAKINNAAIQWALSNAGDAARNRFQKYGVQMVTGDDKPVSLPFGAYVAWVNSGLSFDIKSQNGKDVQVISSPSLIADEYHYCKLLSPGRAMEWIYTDGLNKYYGIHD